MFDFLVKPFLYRDKDPSHYKMLKRVLRTYLFLKKLRHLPSTRDIKKSNVLRKK